MTETKANRRPWILGAFIVSLIATTRPFGADSDTWWHLAIGRYIGAHGIPTVEPFAYSPAAHTWVGQQWLYEVFLAHVVTGNAGGIAVVIMALAGAGAFVFAAVSAPRTVPGWCLAASMVLCAFVAAQILGVRGQVVTVLGCGIALWVLTLWRRGNRRIIWLLPPLMLLWCNLHAGFVTGFLFMFLFAVLPRRQSWGVNGDRRQLLFATLVSFAVTLINPAGLKIYPYVLETFTNPVLTQSIDEWSSPNFHQFFLRVFEATAVMLVVFWITAEGVEWCDVALGLISIAASLAAQRNVALFAVVATPQLARYGYLSWKRLVSRVDSGPTANSFSWQALRRLANAWMSIVRNLSVYPMITAAAIIAVLTYTSVSTIYPQISSSDDGSYQAAHYPVAAANYYAAHYDSQRLYNRYELGGYLVYRFPAGRVVYIYGESAVFGTAALTNYLQILYITSSKNDNWVRDLNALAATHAIVPAQSQETSAFRELGWRIDCYDTAGYVLMTEYPRLPNLTHESPPPPQDAPLC